MVPRETINLNGGASDAEGEVVESVSGVGLEVVANVWNAWNPVVERLTLAKKAAVTQSSQVPPGLAALNFSSLELITLHPSRTAMPFRSDPALAAVGGVFGTVSVPVSMICTLL